MPGEPRKISHWNQTEWTLTPTGYWPCLSLIFLTSSLGTIPPPTIELVSKILNRGPRDTAVPFLPLYWSLRFPAQLAWPHALLPSFPSIH